MNIVTYNNVNLNNTAVALGKFQGLHKGHMILIEEVLRLSYEQDLTSVVFTIDIPQEKTINLRAERCGILSACGIDYNVSCEFSNEFASMTPKEFVSRILVDRLGAQYVVVGTDFRFGNKRLGDVALLKTLGEEFGFKVIDIDKLAIDDIIVSSTYIRELLSKGNMKAVTRYMGRDYFIKGIVQKGRQLGRTIGFPTANIIPDKGKLLPPFGAYYTQVIIDGVTYKAITNVGNNPTIDENGNVTIETNIIDYTDDIYDKEITIYFKDFIREEIKFSNIEDLKEQLQRDRNYVLHQ